MKKVFDVERVKRALRKELPVSLIQMQNGGTAKKIALIRKELNLKPTPYGRDYYKQRLFPRKKVSP